MSSRNSVVHYLAVSHWQECLAGFLFSTIKCQPISGKRLKSVGIFVGRAILVESRLLFVEPRTETWPRPQVHKNRTVYNWR